MNYSAGLMSQSFWFHEFKMVVKLRHEGLDYDSIKKKCIEENLFGAAKEYRATRMTGYIISRVKVMDDTLVELFCTSDLSTQKLINMITILRTDTLFFEFLYEIYREKVMLGSEFLEDADVNVFFSRKETQSELVLGWKDTTKKKLKNIYMNFMTDANMLTVDGKKKIITPPILDIALERYLQTRDEVSMIKALTGVS